MTSSDLIILYKGFLYRTENDRSSKMSIKSLKRGIYHPTLNSCLTIEMLRSKSYCLTLISNRMISLPYCLLATKWQTV